MRRLIITLSIVFAVAAGTPIAYKRYASKARVMLAMAQVNSEYPAYTIIADEFVGSPVKVDTVVARRIFARRSDGSTSKIEEKRNLQVALRSRWTKFADGRTSRVFDHLKAKSTFTLSRFEADARRAAELDPSSNCTNTYARNAPVVGNIDHKGSIAASGRTIPVVFVDASPGRTHPRLIEARATGLACAPIEYRATFAGGDWDYTRVVAVILGEPDRSLFDTPTDYREMRPSELLNSDLDFRYSLAGSSAPSLAHLPQRLRDRFDESYSRRDRVQP